MILLSLVTAFLFAFLDNVTTVILMVPVTFLIADALEISPLPFLLAQVMASNVGGAATLIGASANVVVAGMSERAGKKISFLQFMAYGIPVTLLSLAVATPYLLLRYYL